MTAAVSLAGMLTDAETDAELDAGVMHFLALLSSDVYDQADWEAEAANVLREVLAWGERMELAAANN